MARLTRKINGMWDWASIEGEPVGGIVCHNCGEIMKLLYEQLAFGERYGRAIYGFCHQCFSGDKETSPTWRVGM